MATPKHLTNENADYAEAHRYLLFHHTKFADRPVLNESGEMLSRKRCYLNGLNYDPFTFNADVEMSMQNTSKSKL